MDLKELKMKIRTIDSITKLFINISNNKNIIKLVNKYNKCLTLINSEIEDYMNREDKESESLYINTINLLMEELNTLAFSIQLCSNTVDGTTIHDIIEKLPVNKEVKKKFVNVSFKLLNKKMISELSYILSILNNNRINENLLNYNRLSSEEKEIYKDKTSSQYSKGIIKKEETQILDNISYLTSLLIKSEKDYCDEKVLEFFLSDLLDYQVTIDSKTNIFNYYDMNNQFKVTDIQMSSADTIKSITYQVPQTRENIYVEKIGDDILSKHFFPKEDSSTRYFINDKEVSEEEYYAFLKEIKRNKNQRYKTPVFDDEHFLSDIQIAPVLEEGETDTESSLFRYISSDKEAYLDQVTKEVLTVHRYPENDFIWTSRINVDDNDPIKYYINNEEVSAEDIDNPLNYLNKQKKGGRKKS